MPPTPGCPGRPDLIRRAFDFADALAARNPDWVDAQILVAEILGDTPGAEEEAAQRAASVRCNYKLPAEGEARLAAVEAEIAKSKGTV
jgi:hypothetical protein